MITLFLLPDILKEKIEVGEVVGGGFVHIRQGCHF